MRTSTRWRTEFCVPTPASLETWLGAARRVVEGRPVYFDFLPQISTIVQGEEGTETFDLIPRDELLPAGRVNRSAQPARLGLPADMTTLKIHLRKETEPASRLAVAGLPTPPARAAQVRLHVEQVPAAGRARLTLESEALASPLVVDWDAAEPQDKTWEQMIEALKPELPTVPDRLVLQCGLAVRHGWRDPEGRSHRRNGGLAEPLEAFEALPTDLRVFSRR
jgi:hypothetical protein